MMTRNKLTLAAALALTVAAGGTAALAQGMNGPRGMDAGMRDGYGPRMEEHFTEMDADKDGKVTAAEMRAARAARFAAADANGDGKLTVEEMDDARKAERLARLAKMVVWLDADGDGMLSADEFDPRQGAMLSRMDADGDGALSMEEMRDAKERFHHRMGGRDADDRQERRRADCPMGRPGPKN